LLKWGADNIKKFCKENLVEVNFEYINLSFKHEMLTLLFWQNYEQNSINTCLCSAWSGSTGGGGAGGTAGGTPTTSTRYSSYWIIGSNANQVITGKIKECNWDFKKVTNTWQAATVKRIGIVLVPDGPIIFNLDVGMPSYSQQLERTIPSWEAAQITADASWEAMVEVGREFKLGQINSAAIPNKIAAKTQQKINKKLGFVTQVALVSTQAGTNGGGGVKLYNPNIKCD
jgi:hypothetical protein